MLNLAQSSVADDNLGNVDPSASSMKWSTDQQQFSQSEIEMRLDGISNNIDAGVESNEVTSAPNAEKPLWKRERPVRLVHDRLLGLEEERIRVEKQKLLEKKRCNNIRLKLEKERLEIERQRIILLEKLLVAVEAVVHR
ncbi:unnamed protein product [Parnassius apollo]|uniref:(apollo) hypothetical protein n=1 Tax=Parnassius apollo TaxID=110799 RepID=A0A8S3X7S0_PARAO|nr:unnamed protein product [Parnassius apollo]